MLPIKISHVLITSPIVHPAPQGVADTKMLFQSGLLVFYWCFRVILLGDVGRN